MSDDDTQERPSLREVTEWTGGISWIAYPDERGQRASHALQTAAGVWLVDPVDAEGLDERLAELGDIKGVVVLQDRHTRDASTIARRHDVAVHIPDWMSLTHEKLEMTPELLSLELPETTYTVHQLINTDNWEEAILVNETANTMIVPEALGTLPLFEGADDDALGLHPELDKPPQRLSDWEPERILVGHGKSIHNEANAKLRTVLNAG
jgi:hypothetical protein